jgi:ABC-type transport system substrate-binding protein
LDQAAATLDQTKSIPMYQQIQKMAMEQAWVLPIRDYTNINALSAKVKGLTYDVHGWFPYFYDVKVEN